MDPELLTDKEYEERFGYPRVIPLELIHAELAELADLIAIYLHQQAQAEARAEEAT